MNWYRVTIGETGKPLSIAKCAAPEDEQTVVYVQASSEKDAWGLALAAYNRERVKQQRAQRKAEGRCRCGRVRDCQWQKCRVCRERENVAKRESKNQPGPKVRSEEQRIASLKDRHRERRAELRVETLLQVREAWVKSANLRQFEAWLYEATSAALAGEDKCREMSQEEIDSEIIAIAERIQERRREELLAKSRPVGRPRKVAGAA